jgi:threonine aldolase
VYFLRTIDLRSDTVTKPSPEMWTAVKNLDHSQIGDDVMREDPLVNELEERAAKIMGKDASLLVTSGTQGNLISLLSHTLPGNEILVEEESHIFIHEVGSAARIGGLMTRTYQTDSGVPSLDELQLKIRNKEDIHEPPTTLLCAENTHNAHGGRIIYPSQLEDMKKFAEYNGLKFHLDGARIFNASIASNFPVKDFTKNVDSIMFCLSKGLCCPIGSIVAGSSEFIDKARKFRKMLGGGMRQAGIIAVFGLIALEDNWIKRLKADHNNAKLLSEGLKQIKIPIKVQDPETNILMVDFPKDINMSKILSHLSKEGILAFIESPRKRIRFVTHYGINEDDIAYAVQKIEKVLKSNLN